MTEQEVAELRLRAFQTAANAAAQRPGGGTFDETLAEAEKLVTFVAPDGADIPEPAPAFDLNDIRQAVRSAMFEKRQRRETDVTVWFVTIAAVLGILAIAYMAITTLGGGAA